ncbi:MAG: GNAT family N-acetyltransferase [Lachnospiraceae bacterium]|nr:GNAT family N-acetyltransferase [Lachnospiraceae bacterium]
MDYFEIKTERLVLKPLGKSYLNSTIRYAMDYENTKYMCYLPDETVEEAEEFLTNVENEWKKEKPQFLEFAVIYDDEHIGAVSVYFENDTGELGWIIHKDHWGNGFAYEAAKALIDYVKSEIKVNHFLAHCDTENTASYKVMEKLGMSRTGEWGGRRNKSAVKDSSEYQYELYYS